MDSTLKNESMQQKLFQMQSKQVLTDVVFLVGENKSPIYAHKNILCSRSNVFYQMFVGSLAEENSKINIPDIEENIFNSVLKYLYTDEVTIDKVTVENLLYVAEKYDLQSLKMKCSEYLCTDLKDVCSALLALQLAEKYNVDKLKQESLQKIAQNSGELFGSQQFLEANADVVKILLDCDDLKLQEIDIYQAVIKWAQEECKRQDLSICDANIRRVARDLLPCIRFPIMPKSKLEEIIDKDILLPEEKIDVLKCFSFNTCKSKYFSMDQRTNFEQVKRFTDVTGKWNSGVFFDAVQFTVQKAALLKGVHLYKSAVGQSAFIISLLDESKIFVVATGCYDEYEIEGKSFEVLFSSIVQLQPGQTYIIEARTCSCRSFYGDCGISDLPFGNGNQISFSTCKYSANNTSSRGQIPIFLLSDCLL